MVEKGALSGAMADQPAHLGSLSTLENGPSLADSEDSSGYKTFFMLNSTYNEICPANFMLNSAYYEICPAY